MRLSRAFFQTLRETPSDTEVVSHQLLLRAGFIHQAGAGIFSYLPLAQRSLQRLMNIMREEMNNIGGQEILMPVVQPADTWMETGRYFQIGDEMARFNDRTGHPMVLAMTHEESVADLVRSVIHSYRQLPALVYHLQTKWRDDPRPRAGLIRVREFTMLDSYSLDADQAGLEEQYQAHYQSYFRIFERCGIPVIAVSSDSGMMGGKQAHEYMYLSPVGEDSLAVCDHCGYSANRQVALFQKPPAIKEEMLSLERVETINTTTIEGLAQLLHIPASRTAKAVFFIAEKETSPGEICEEFLFTVVRGDMEVNETKVANLVQARSLRPATHEEILAAGAVPGYASPIGLKDVRVVVDELAAASANLVAGANEPDHHLLNVNYSRDYQADEVADITSVQDGDPCIQCGNPLRLVRGVEVGNIFQLGTRYSDALGCTFLDDEGAARPVIMGSYGIGVGRLLACIAEEHHDERGLTWPVSVAPFPVHLVILPGREVDTSRVAEMLEAELLAADLEPLVDDRVESAGVKFNDADLIGLPLRITVSERSLKQGGVELKPRKGSESLIVPLTEVLTRVQTFLAGDGLD